MADFNFYLNRQGVKGNKGEKGETGFAPIVEGQSYSGLEVPNAAIATVSFKDVLCE